MRVRTETIAATADHWLAQFEVEGEIGLVQFSDITGFVAEGAGMRSGETLAADL